jgi:hypothetical protein
MSYELINRSVPCSRRHLLLGAVAAVSAVTVVGTDPSTAVAVVKISEAAVGYQNHPNGDKECSKCMQFQPPNSCKMVTSTWTGPGLGYYRYDIRNEHLGGMRRDQCCFRRARQ